VLALVALAACSDGGGTGFLATKAPTIRVKPVVALADREAVLAATEALKAKLAGLGYRVVEDDDEAVAVASRFDLRLPLPEAIRFSGEGAGVCTMVSDLSRRGASLGEAQARLGVRFTGLDAGGEIPPANIATVIRRCAERQAEAIARALGKAGL